MRVAKLKTTADQLGLQRKMGRFCQKLLAAAWLTSGLLVCSLSNPVFASADDAPPCKGSLFQSPWDHQISANLLVKRGEPCQIKLRINDAKDISITRNPKRGKIEPVPETANVIYTPNNQTTGRDRFVYRSIRKLADDKELTQTIIVEVEILSQADYPYNFAVVDTGLPPPPPPAPSQDYQKTPPEAGKPPKK